MTKKNNIRKLLCGAGIMLVLFFALILAVKFIDVRAIGPQGSEIGLATLNDAVGDLIGVNGIWYDITEITGLISIAVAFGFALFGGYQLICRKSIKKIDSDIILLGFFYAAVIALYVLFEIIIINYRPIITEGELEASFPSSHTMLVTCIMGSAIYQFINRIKNNLFKNISVALSAVIIAITIIGRLLSGVHWLTDIIGGVIISIALILLYMAVCEAVKNKQ